MWIRGTVGNRWKRLCSALSYGALLCVFPACGGDSKVSLINDPPGVTFTSPTEMEVFLLTEPILLAARVSDPQTPNELLDLSWGFSPEGSVNGVQEILEDEVTLLLEDGLEAGAYTVGLLAVDPIGARDSDSVSFTVKENDPPSVTILDPVEARDFAVGSAVEVVLDIQDLDQRNIHEIILEWGGVAAGDSAAPEHPNSDGSAGFYLTGLEIGQYVLTVSATDSLGAVDSDNCVFNVVDGDIDGDGYVDVEYGGDDCDDGDSTINPLADEICDGIDNDCDSTVDEDDAVDALDWYADLDMDSYGDPTAPTQACVQPAGYVDNDEDCNDGDSSVFPGAIEYCDGQDDDCDGEVDEDDAVDVSAWYIDLDFDSYGDVSQHVLACSAPAGYVAANTDCDDSNALISPGANEYCDGVDNNCDGAIDEATAVDASIWYADSDGDDFGNVTSSVVACSPPNGYVADNTDCDDTLATVNPNGLEYCDSIDNDCDTAIDEADALDAPSWYADSDGDGYGALLVSIRACSIPSGFVSNSLDCDDTDPSISPISPEYCDGIDNDCDEVVDEPTAVDAQSWFADVDGDGYGDATSAVFACNAPSGTVADNTDCDDNPLDGSAINPSAIELCDGTDNDCSGGPDAAELDSDSDGHVACTLDPGGWDGSLTSGFSSMGGDDCNDLDANISPVADEYCNTVDDDCDGQVDEADALDASRWYADSDSDGFGDLAQTQSGCSVPSGFVGDGTDCDDTASTVHPGADEYCNAVDDDCDGELDEDHALDVTAWYSDQDQDGYGDANTSVSTCNAPTGMVADATDCDDNPVDGNAVNPAASEICDGIDNDCDGTTDEPDAVDATNFYLDSDGDTYGDPATGQPACSASTGRVANGDDCADSLPLVNPDAIEVCDGIDNDCNGSTDGSDAQGSATWYTDSDGDGYGNPNVFTGTCAQPSGTVLDSTDCNDVNPAVNPAATEICDTIDNNCDGSTDGSDSADAQSWYTDVDGDGYGDPSSLQTACTQPANTISDGTDCNDASPPVNPAATEVCDTVDNDCDGTVDESDAADAQTWYSDTDGDSFGDSSSSILSCNEPPNSSLLSSDCDDTQGTINPDAVEVCDTVDNDCDGTIDESDSADAQVWYADSDSDGYGDSGNTVSACSQPSAYSSVSGDCNDGDTSVWPGGTEVCDGQDNDCNGAVLSTEYDDDSDGYVECALDSGGWDGSLTSGFTSMGGEDCDDGNFVVNPGAAEICDGLDNDCSGSAQTSEADDDSDGYVECSIDSGGWNGTVSVSGGDDCDDTRATVNPGGTEVCDYLDNDCDGSTDGTDAIDAPNWYLDNDGDHYGDSSTGVISCAPVSGRITTGGDCDDTPGSGASVNPTAAEVCDGLDNDCNGTVDGSESTDASTWFADLDSDGYGNANSSLLACTNPLGYVADATDCNDLNYFVNPGVIEICGDFADNNCDGGADSCGINGTLSAGVSEALLTGESSQNYAGSAMAEIGDMTGDGKPDLLIGAYRNSEGGIFAGGAYIIKGYDPTNPAGYVQGALSGQSSLSNNYAKVYGEDAGDRLGYAVDYVGDFDGDGNNDIVLGAYEYEESTNTKIGAVYIMRGPLHGSTAATTQSIKLTGVLNDGYLGAAVAGPGDINNDTYDDVVVGADGTTNNRGTAYVCYGNYYTAPVQAVDQCQLEIRGVLANDNVGSAISGAGDITGDGYADFMVGAYGDDSGGGGAGMVSVFEGPVASPASGWVWYTDGDIRYIGESGGDNAGWAIDEAGDVNADGYADLLIGSWGHDDGSISNVGKAYLVTRAYDHSGDVDLSVATASFEGEDANHRAGYSVAGVGDVEGDGWDDLLVSSPWADGKAGRVYLIYGNISGNHSLADSDAMIQGESANDYYGRAMTSTGDTNGDGFRDFLVGARGEDTAGGDAGAAYLMFGQPRL